VINEDCPNYARCGRHGHYQENGRWVRCPCLVMSLNRSRLGPMYCPKPRETTQLTDKIRDDLLIEGPLLTVRPHIARVLLDMAESGKSHMTMDAYRLVEIFLEKDDSFDSVNQAVNPDILVLLLGFADPPNKYLPELILQVLRRRALLLKPTWVLLGIAFDIVWKKYSPELADELKTNFSRVEVRK